MALFVGDRLGAYEILAPVGAGGMGEVYRARDTVLKRNVALKVLPEAFARDPQRMARFQREAEVLASLNHPNIAAIYGVVESGDTRALVMELAEGPTLAARIKEGAIPQEESLAIARQITDALEYAHEKGVVHRDLKPANVKITPQETVKLLDFGLAKAFSEPSAGGDPNNSPTLTMGETRAGVILGTAAYMAPEQARGKQVDKRADIWAFGVVLYEMLTGRRMFTGELMSDVLAAVIAKEPDLEAVPARFRPIIQKCLRKDPRTRWRDIGDVRMALEEDLQAGPALLSPARAAPAILSVAWITVGVLAIVLAILGFVHFRETPAVAQPVRLQIPIPEGMAFNAGTFAISPDGRRVAFGAGTTDGPRRLWIRELDSLELKPLPGTEIPAIQQPPFWSPDSRVLAYGVEGKLKKVNISGEPPQTVCDAVGPTGGAWNQDGTIVFGSNTGALRRCPASGGAASPVTVLAQGETAHRWPQFLPDGRHFLYARASNVPERTGVFIGSIDTKPAEQDLKPLLITDRQAYYVPPGWLLFVREDALMAQPFDPAKLALSGEATPIANTLGSFLAARYAFFTVSGTGVVLYRGGGGGLLQLTWLDAQGTRSTIGEPGLWARPAVSPDGTRVAASLNNAQGSMDIWVLDTKRGTSTRLTFDPANDDRAVWSPDGGKIAFRCNRGGHADLYVKASDGSGDDQLLLKTDEEKIPESWSHDGRYLLYDAISPKTGGDLWVLPLGGDRKPFPFLQTQFNEGVGQFSPDMRWIAYVSDESGTPEVYVRPFAPDSGGPSVSGGKWMV